MSWLDTLGDIGASIGNGLETASGVIGDIADLQASFGQILGGGSAPSPPPGLPPTFYFPPAPGGAVQVENPADLDLAASLAASRTPSLGVPLLLGLAVALLLLR